MACGLVALSSQQARDGDVLVQRFPMQAAAADADLLALFGGGVQEPGEPCQRYADNSTVAEIDPHAIWIEVHSRWANGRIHALTLLHFPYRLAIRLHKDREQIIMEIIG